MRPIHWDDVAETRRDVGEVHSAWRDLSTAAGGERLGIQRVVADPGCRSTAPHVHADAEELFYVLAGDGLLWHDGETHAVAAGDLILHRVREEVHCLRAGDDGLTVLACGPRPANLTWWPRIDAGRIGAGTSPAFEGLPWEYEEASAGPLDFPAPTPRPDTVVAVDEVEARRIADGRSAFVERNLGRAVGARRTAMRLQDIDPAGMGYEPHMHAAAEEQFVVLSGAGRVWIGDERHEVRAGSVVARPAATGVSHAFEAGEAGLRVLAYGERDGSDLVFNTVSQILEIPGLRLAGRLIPLDDSES